MMAILLGLVVAHPVLAPVHKEKTVYHIQAVVYQGNPDGNKAKGNVNIISSPKLVTTNGQMAQVQIGTVVPVVSDIQIKKDRIHQARSTLVPTVKPAAPQAITPHGTRAPVYESTTVTTEVGGRPTSNIITKTLVAEQVGLTLNLTATEQPDGSIFLNTYVQAKQLVKENDGTDSVLERAIKVRRLSKLGEKITVTLYDPNDYIERIKVQGSDEIQTRTKPYTGKETWVELVVTEHKP